MSLASGIFTAPRTGTYFFAFTAVAFFPASAPGLAQITVAMYLNGNFIGEGYSDDDSPVQQYGSFSFKTTLSLEAGDKIWLAISFISPSVYLTDGTTHHYTHFTGWLLQEDISKSIINSS